MIPQPKRELVHEIHESDSPDGEPIGMTERQAQDLVTRGLLRAGNPYLYTRPDRTIVLVIPYRLQDGANHAELWHALDIG